MKRKVVIFLIGILLAQFPVARSHAIAGRDMAMVASGSISVGLAVALIISAIRRKPIEPPKVTPPVEPPLATDNFVPTLPQKNGPTE